MHNCCHDRTHATGTCAALLWRDIIWDSLELYLQCITDQSLTPFAECGWHFPAQYMMGLEISNHSLAALSCQPLLIPQMHYFLLQDLPLRFCLGQQLWMQGGWDRPLSITKILIWSKCYPPFWSQRESCRLSRSTHGTSLGAAGQRYDAEAVMPRGRHECIPDCPAMPKITGTSL